jgi:HEAT repeat protein
MNEDVASLVEKAVMEEQAQPELTDEGHDWPTAEQIGRSPTALEAAGTLAGSPDPRVRAVAAHVLSGMVNGNDDGLQVAEAVRVLDEMLQGSDDVHVAWSIADALRLAWHPDAIRPLLRLERSPAANTRRSVAEGLSGAMSGRVDPDGVEALIRLSTDPDLDVRDWATFSLAQLDDDSPALRTALRARLDDPDYDIRSEALVGLAQRQDRSVIDRVAMELQADNVGKLVVEAAAELAEPDLLQPLLALERWWDVDPELLRRAIDASRSSSSA